ncbi:NgoFVII family restriction endonuclease [Butyrivibrio fibrisolvens]|uniref:restriction endonuclease PLD domain-containing protein n=1 Tax=Pseudobutyrivibrio ruminis TaxID=46206 RepID=UPI000410536F|nr:restriction endonuclease PLD domain-containing protein [Pseudobutyrivibrio ruminis]MDC7278062.1 NgoFVII family restriction endonuclease [Butyrivibrio fibrisolvens]
MILLNTRDVQLITKDFDEPILYEPALIENGCNDLKIISGFTDCDRISTHMIGLADRMETNQYMKNISVDLIVGMTKTGMTLKKHNDICRLVKYLQGTRKMPKINCYYISNGPEVHSKVYLWSKKTDETSWGLYPWIAYSGSLNYTNNAFYKRREVVSPCDPLSAFMYYQDVFEDTINCLDPQAVERVKNVSNKKADEYVIEDVEDKDYSYYDKLEPVETIRVSLLKANGEGTGYGSGINWGIRKNGYKRNQNQAYIPYNVDDRVPGFFPDRINPDDKNCPIFKVITKDFGSFHMRMAQQGNKALHSAESNAILGEWIRKRINCPSGGYITKEMLDIYGKTYVTFRKYDDGTYLLDF